MMPQYTWVRYTGGNLWIFHFPTCSLTPCLWDSHLLRSFKLFFFLQRAPIKSRRLLVKRWVCFGCVRVNFKLFFLQSWFVMDMFCYRRMETTCFSYCFSVPWYEAWDAAYWSSRLLKPYVASSFCIEVHLFRSSKVIWGISAQSCKYEMKVCCYVLHVHRAATYSLSLRVFSLHFAECWEVFWVDIFDLKWIIIPSNQLLRFCLPFCRWTPRPVTYWTTCRWSWTTYWMNSAAHLGTGSLILTPQDTHTKLNNS